jgi:hypothetical protein
MKIEIELNDNDARVLRSMASLGRYCDAVLRVCDLAPNDNDDADIVAETTTLIKPALMSLHLQIRDKLVAADVKPLWDQNQKVR